MTPETVALQQENIRLRARVKELEDRLGIDVAIPHEWKLTKTERAIFVMLVRREIVQKTAIFDELYAERSDGGPETDVINVFVSKLRRKVQPHGVEILSSYGVGFYLAPEVRARLVDDFGGLS